MAFERAVEPLHSAFSSFRPLHSSFVRKHVPDSDPGCALQSTSMPALHRRNVPNCRLMAVGGMRKCSAGACPPLGSGWGVAESAVPIRCTKPQLRLFLLWCAGTNRHERSAMKARPGLRSGIDCSSSLSLVIPAPRFVIPAIESMPRTPIRGRNPEGWREGNVARGLVPRLGRAASSPALHHPALSHFHPLVRPSQDHGDSRHPTRHSGEGRNPDGWGEGNVAPGASLRQSGPPFVIPAKAGIQRGGERGM